MITGDKHGACKLCLSKTKALCQSHVVPEFCYEYEYKDSRRHAFAINLPNTGQLRKKTVQKGHREYLLCPDCEQRLSRHERIFAGYWESKAEIKGPLNHGQRVILDGADYLSTKLFILSVFWRSSVSQTFGKGMRLGPYAEKLRILLLNNQYVPQDHYPLLCSIILDPNGFPFNGYVDNPYCSRIEGAHVYQMAFGGCMWAIVMSDHGIPKELESMKHFFSDTGQIYLIAKNCGRFPSIRQIGRAIQRSEGTNV